MFLRIPTFGFMFLFYVCVTTAAAEEVRVAVAANFLSTLNEIITNFQADTSHTILVSSGSSGKLYAQIKNGAPFDVFFSADAERPQLLEEEGLAVKGSRFVYSIGRLTLWSPDSNVIQSEAPHVLSDGRFEHLAIANVQCQRLSVSGFSFCGTDIGGFAGETEGELFIRWLQLAVFHPVFRIHSMGNNVDGAPALEKTQSGVLKEVHVHQQETSVASNLVTGRGRGHSATTVGFHDSRGHRAGQNRGQSGTAAWLYLHAARRDHGVLDTHQNRQRL